MKEWGSGNSFSHSPPKPPVRLTGLRVSQMGAGYLPSIGRWTATLSLLPSRLPSHILPGLAPETVPPLSHSFWIWVLSRHFALVSSPPRSSSLASEIPNHIGRALCQDSQRPLGRIWGSRLTRTELHPGKQRAEPWARTSPLSLNFCSCRKGAGSSLRFHSKDYRKEQSRILRKTIVPTLPLTLL